MTSSHRPRRAGSALSMLVAAVAVGVVASAPGQRSALAVGAVGAVVLWAGLRWSERSALGVLVAGLGVIAVLVGLAFGVAGTASIRHGVEVVPGIAGMALLGAGLGRLRTGRERLLVSAGTALVLGTVLVSGAIRGASTLALLAAGATTVLAWDLAEQAINLGEQVGESAGTYRGELVHGTATAGVAGAAVGATWVVRGLDVTGLPLSVVLLLLGAAVALTLVLYN